MKQLKHNLYFKVAIIIALALLLLIPSAMIQQMVSERQRNQEFAVNDVSSKWAQAQTISGLYITIPYRRYEKRNVNNRDRIVEVKDYIYILPENLEIKSQIEPTKKHRGIYEVVVYDADLSIEGDFASFDLTTLDLAEEDLMLDGAMLNLGISDLKGIDKKVKVQWNNKTLEFESGLDTRQISNAGISIPIDLDSSKLQASTFKTSLDLKGSQQLYFIPLGKSTHVEMDGIWESPRFNGEYIPDNWEEKEDGFMAEWDILNLNRNYPQVWQSSEHHVHSSAFGTDFFIPVDRYHKTYRVAKYALLFICITFLIFFFVEVLQKVHIHPMQYLLVGLALVIFYTLLLSISEHLTFNSAYVVSMVLTIGLILFYVRAILKLWPITLLTGGLLGIMYTFIFTIIQMEDYALLIGSLGAFVILAIVMFASRKIDWYNLKGQQPEEEIPWDTPETDA